MINLKSRVLRTEQEAQALLESLADAASDHDFENEEVEL